SLVQIGFTVFVIPYDIVKNPLKLKQYFLDNRITVAFLSPSILRIIGDDLGPYMQYVFTGSEPANGISLDGIRLINTYSMSEGAFTLAQFEIDRPYDICPVGKPNYEGINLILVDEEGHEVPPGESGEICFDNPFMRGYINLPDETAKALRNGVYHTGDLGRKLPDGNLILLGRANDMIKINGNRTEPAEIEKAFKTVTGVSFCCAKGFEEKTRSFICLYYTGEVLTDENDVREKMKEILPYYMIPSYFVHIVEVPLLPNGKINKKMLLAPGREDNSAPYEAPRDELESHLCMAMAAVLSKDRVGIRDDFYHMGGDSLTAMALLAKADLPELTAADIFNGCTVAKIAEIYRKRTEGNASISPGEYEMEARRHAYPPFAVQVSFIDMQLYSPRHPIFNIPVCYEFEDVSIAEDLAEALNAVIENSPIFSTRFGFSDDNELVVRYVPDSEPKVTVQKVTAEEFAKISSGFNTYFARIFDAPMYKCGIYVTKERGYLLMVFHHMIIDGMGVQVFLNRLLTAYRKKELPMDTYYTTLRRYNEERRSPAYKEAEDYMNSMYGGTNWSRNFEPDITDGVNEQGIFPIPVKISRQDMDEFEKRTGFTRSQMCAAALILGVAKCNGKDDIMIAGAFHNRVDHSTKNALSIQLRKVPTGIRLGQISNMQELLEGISKQSIDSIRFCSCEYIIDTERPFLDDYVTMTYETSDIMSGGVSAQIGMKSYQCPANDAYAAIRFAYQVFDTAAGINPMLIYSKKFYSDARIGQIAKVMTDINEKLIKVTDPASMMIRDIIS
ncbi:MAG: AMP-binding protein, partial [Lachnospiraceae bacterium]|nr:AMP-binding protein [Lachnospiraceae bacterium]